jgi:hypothetical protein
MDAPFYSGACVPVLDHLGESMVVEEDAFDIWTARQLSVPATMGRKPEVSFQYYYCCVHR